jgi:hypothetical protein
VSPVVGRLSPPPPPPPLRYRGKISGVGRTADEDADCGSYLPSLRSSHLHASGSSSSKETFAYWVTNPIPTHTTRRRFLTENKHPHPALALSLNFVPPCGKLLSHEMKGFCFLHRIGVNIFLFSVEWICKSLYSTTRREDQFEMWCLFGSGGL